MTIEPQALSVCQALLNALCQNSPNLSPLTCIQVACLALIEGRQAWSKRTEICRTPDTYDDMPYVATCEWRLAA
jgi:hypothetical protein